MDGGILCNMQVLEKMDVDVDVIGPWVAGLEAPVDVACWLAGAPKSWIFLLDGWWCSLVLYNEV